MPNTLSGSLTAGCQWNFQRPNPGQTPVISDESLSKKIAYTNGVGANQCNQLYSAVRTLAAGASEDIDLAASLTNLLGDLLITFARIKGFRILLMGTGDTAADGTVGTACSSIVLGAAAANPWLGPLGGTAPTLTIQNGMFLEWATPSAAGFPVVAATGDILKVLNGDGAAGATFQLTLFGCMT
jgi:hypothetical protein